MSPKRAAREAKRKAQFAGIDFYARAVHAEDGRSDGRRGAPMIAESHIERAYIDGSKYHQNRIEEFRPQ
jgi:hypothetical protein